MSREDIIRMARQTRLLPEWVELCRKDEEALVRFADLVAAAAIKARETNETTTPHKEDNATTTCRHITPPYAIGVASEGASRKT